MPKYGEPIYGTVTETNPIVKTTHGFVKGENRNGVAIFRGIPYGGDCGKENRFLPPTIVSDWDGIRDCTKNGHYAVQPGKGIFRSGLRDYFTGGKPELFGLEGEEQGEDCLVLNVLTPGLDTQKRPVVVYIHGGGFCTGSGDLVLGADKWVREEDIIVVGVNHRLNAFGYLYLGAFDPKYKQSGMSGMLDLVLALEWVRDNIAVFGGDPDRVTIMGESGGGMKVSTLMAMEKAKGLFRYAIVESGSDAVGNFSREEATKIAKELLDRLNVPTDRLEKLYEIPHERFIEAMIGHGKWKDIAMNFCPVADEINLPYSAEKIAPEISKDFTLMVGASEDENAIFVPLSKTKDITWGNLKDILLQPNTSDGGLKPHFSAGKVDEIIRVFRENSIKENTAEHVFFNIISMGGILGGGAFRQALAKAKQGGAPVYHYLIAFDTPHPENSSKRFSWHTADLPLQMRIVLHSESEWLSKAMAHSWAAFIRNGNPSTNGFVWPAFMDDRRNVMVFDKKIHLEIDPQKKKREVLESL